MTVNAKKVLGYLQSAGVGVKFTTNEIKDALGFDKPAAVVGSLRGMVKSGFVERSEELDESSGDKPKYIKYFSLTADGAKADANAAE